jgi:hypothetical protein
VRRAGSIFLYLMAGLVALLTYLDMLGLAAGMVLGGVLILAAFAVQVVGLGQQPPAG